MADPDVSVILAAIAQDPLADEVITELNMLRNRIYLRRRKIKSIWPDGQPRGERGRKNAALRFRLRTLLKLVATWADSTRLGDGVLFANLRGFLHQPYVGEAVAVQILNWLEHPQVSQLTPQPA